MDKNMSEPTKRKRGRPAKNDRRYINFPTSHLTDVEVEELVLGYSLLKEILAIQKIKPLLDEPDENLYGQHDYYSVIEKPMWFNEISRKYKSMEYREVKQVVDDIRQVLENTYIFWGIKNKLGQLAYELEQIVDKHTNKFPKHLKELCSLGALKKPTVINSMDHEKGLVVTQEYDSKILENLAKKNKSETDKEVIIDPALKKWEHEILIDEEKAEEIRIIAALPEIGQFIKLSSEILGFNDVTQYEVERMLLMPKESTTLATIMTRLLCPTSMITNLHLKPIMTYDVWTSFLKNKLEEWYILYSISTNKLQLFMEYGIEPYFWETLGEQNPLVDCDFHSLNHSKKACILKALCTTTFHSNNQLEVLFNSVSGESLREETIFTNSRFTYISLFGPETRVYRLSNNHTGLKHMIETIVPDCEDTSFVEDQESAIKQQFYMLVSNKESLNLLRKTLTRKKLSFAVIHNLLKRDESDKYYLKGLKAMFTQWQKSPNRTTVIENSINHWMKEEKEITSNESDWENDNKTRSNHIESVKAEPSIFDKRTFKQSLDDSIQKIRTSVTPVVSHPKINYISTSGVRITRNAINHRPRRSIVDAAIENGKPIDFISNTNCLIIDMKTGTSTSQILPFEEELLVDPSINFNQMTNFDYTNNFQPFSEHNINNSMSETGNNVIIPNSEQNLDLKNFYENYQPQYDDSLLDDPTDEIMAMPFIDSSDQAQPNFDLDDVSQVIPSTFNEHPTF